MISAFWLLLIVPASVYAGFAIAALLSAAHCGSCLESRRDD
jgi:hypothetical protein